MARRSDHSREELQTLILDAAEKLVTKSGPAALNARALAGAIGYSPGTLYNVFRNVDDIVLHVNARTMDRLQTELAGKPGPDPTRELRRLAHAYVDFAVANRPVWQLLFDHAFAPDFVMPEDYLGRIDSLFSIVEAPLAAVATSKDTKKLRNLAFALWSSVHGACTLLVGRDYRTFEQFQARKTVDLLVDVFVSGLGASGPAVR